MAPPPHRSISKTMGHDIDDRCDVDIDSIDAIEDRNRWLDFDIDSRLDSIRFPPPAPFVWQGIFRDSLF